MFSVVIFVSRDESTSAPLSAHPRNWVCVIAERLPANIHAHSLYEERRGSLHLDIRIAPAVVSQLPFQFYRTCDSALGSLNGG